MKICLYTITNFVHNAINCIDLLLQSINKKYPYDFYIITNTNINSNQYNILYDNKNITNYVGYLKYSNVIPQNYDYYIYLDSDILFFDSLDTLVSIDKPVSLVKEPYMIKNHEWFYFQYIENLNDKLLISQSNALNAGSFAFRKDQFHIIYDIYTTYCKYSNKCHSTIEQAKLEQSIFNFHIHKAFDFSIDGCYDITRLVQLFASESQPSIDKKLYHFCGYTNEMMSKYQRMKNFYNEYQKSNC
jgi:hypothetical protein